MQDEKFKQIYAFVSLVITLLWAAFCVWMTYRAVMDKVTTDILAASGANVLLGALLVWNGNVNQFYYRKAKPETPDVPLPPAPPAASTP